MKIFILAIALIGLSGCATGFTRTGYTPPLEKLDSKTAKTKAPKCNVAIKYKMDTKEKSKKLGEVEAYDPFWLALHCCEDLALSTFIQDACSINANVVNIVEETPGSIWHCYTAKAELLSVSSKEIKSDEKYAADKIKYRSEKMDSEVHALMAGAVVGGVIGGVVVGSAAGAKAKTR